jgi:hypothetical protein
MMPSRAPEWKEGPSTPIERSTSEHAACLGPPVLRRDRFSNGLGAASAVFAAARPFAVSAAVRVARQTTGRREVSMSGTSDARNSKPRPKPVHCAYCARTISRSDGKAIVNGRHVCAVCLYEEARERGELMGNRPARA